MHSPVLPTTAPPPRRTIDAGWRQWIAEQRLRDCTPESMLATMTGAGLDAAESQAVIAAATAPRPPIGGGFWFSQFAMRR